MKYKYLCIKYLKLCLYRKRLNNYVVKTCLYCNGLQIIIKIGMRNYFKKHTKMDSILKVW